MKLFDVLRAEILTMVTEIGRYQLFKLTALGAIFASAGAVVRERPAAAVVALLVAPILAVCIDLIIESRNGVSRRIGRYIRTEIEPLLFDQSRLEREFGPRAAQFTPWELYVVVGRAGWKRWSVRALSNWIVTLIASGASLVALNAGAGLLARDATLPRTMYVLWSIVVLVLITVDLWIIRAPRDYTSVSGRSGDPVLARGIYSGLCACGERVAPTVLGRNERFPYNHEAHSVVWTLHA